MFRTSGSTRTNNKTEATMRTPTLMRAPTPTALTTSEPVVGPSTRGATLEVCYLYINQYIFANDVRFKNQSKSTIKSTAFQLVLIYCLFPNGTNIPCCYLFNEIFGTFHARLFHHHQHTIVYRIFIRKHYFWLGFIFFLWI